jgi:ABC-2 type transport system ATP-binding protein
MIELAHLTKQFGARLAVDDLSLRVPAGEIFGLLGHNGAGKSTAIGMMLGQVWPTSGSVRVCGYEVTSDRRGALQSVGAIFETPVFYDYLSGYRNLEILSHYTAPTPRQRLYEVIDWVGLSGREKSCVRTYSHGMRARLALAQALLPQPKLLILDEPSDGLDPEGIHEIRQTILRLHGELGMTICLSSHLLNEVEQLCTRIAVLKRGRLLFEGSLAQAKARQSLVRLRTDDFPAATRELTAAGLICSHRDGQYIVLAHGVGCELVVRHLVARHWPVHEIAPQEMTLEDFYLELMRSHQETAKPSGAGGREQPACPAPAP